MKNRIVEYNNININIINDNGIEYVEVRPIIEGLNLKWVNEYKYIRKSNFNSTSCYVPNKDGKLRLVVVIPFGQFESYLNSFKNRHGRFLPPENFFNNLQEYIDNLPKKIFKSNPDYEKSKIQMDIENNVHKRMEDLNKNSKPNSNIEEIEENLEEENNNKENIRAQLEAVSYTAFPIDDNFKIKIDNVISTIDLFIGELGLFNESLKELRKSQFVLLQNKNGE